MVSPSAMLLHVVGLAWAGTSSGTWECFSAVSCSIPLMPQQHSQDCFDGLTMHVRVLTHLDSFGSDLYCY